MPKQAKLNNMQANRLNRAAAKAGFSNCDYDWNQGKSHSTFWADLTYNGRIYRLSSDSQVTNTSPDDMKPLLNAVAKTIEAFAQIAESKVLPLSILLTSVPSRPDLSNLPACILALGFDHIPSESELRKRYRELAKKVHPDRAGGDSKLFQALNENYDMCKRMIGG